MVAMNHPDEFDDVRVPSIELPWPGQCHPQAAAVEQTMIDWGLRHGLIPDDTYLERVARSRYGLLAARCYPQAELPLMQVLADYFLWLFLADDLVFDRVETVSVRTIRSLTAMIDVVEFDRTAARPVYGETALFDVCHRLRQILSPEHFDRFARGTVMWACAAALQILEHLQPAPVGMESYLAIRRHTSGLASVLSVSDAANLGPVTPVEYHHPAMVALRRQTGNIVAWSNDLHSFRVETLQPGQFRNIVTVYQAEGLGLRDAVDRTAGRIRAEVAAFVELSATVQAWASPAVHGCITGMRDWMRGYQDWFEHDTGRYNVHDADDRAVMARLHPQ
jgi:Terpene synthase family 2, C-terminal metal binding